MPVKLGGDKSTIGGTIQATASGAIAIGKPVILNSNGTVSAAGGLAGGAMYLCGTGNSREDVNEFSLSTAYDISTATYTQRLLVSTNNTQVEGIHFKPDGTKMFILDGANAASDVTEYALSTAWNVSTATYTDNLATGLSGEPHGITFGNSGLALYIGEYGSYNFHQYTLSTAWDVSTGSWTRTLSLNGTPYPSQVEGIAFNSAGTKMFLGARDLDDIVEYHLSTAWDISSASYDSVFAVQTQSTNLRDVQFNSDGTKMYIVDDTDDELEEYALSTAYDVSTASYTRTKDVGNSYNGNDTNTGVFFGDGMNANTKNYLGVAQAAVSNGEVATIQIIGSINESQSGLTPGETCYIQRDGSISNTSSACVAGLALSPTKMLVKGNCYELFADFIVA